MLERSHSPFEMVSSQANIAAQDDPRYANRHVWTSIAAQSGGGPRRVVVFGGCKGFPSAQTKANNRERRTSKAWCISDSL